MISDEKKLIRKNIKETLFYYKDNFSKDSESIMKIILQSPQFKNANTILSYMALPDEVFLDNNTFNFSKNVFIPKVVCETGKIDFYKFDENLLKAGAYDILEPAIEDFNNNIPEKFNINALEKYGKILILVPGRAFTVQGHRLGRGKGFYDKFLGTLFSLFEKSHKNITISGVCFKPQLINNIPTDEHDILMDNIFTTK